VPGSIRSVTFISVEVLASLRLILCVQHIHHFCRYTQLPLGGRGESSW